MIQWFIICSIWLKYCCSMIKNLQFSYLFVYLLGKSSIDRETNTSYILANLIIIIL